MDLIINYHPNETGSELARLLKNENTNVFTREIKLLGVNYLEINISDATAGAKKIINNAKSIKNSLDGELMANILSLNSIASDFDAAETVIRKYDVLICDLQIISIRLTILSKAKGQVKYIRETENSKIAEMSKKAIYLSGLDIGIVTIVLTSKRRLRVREINSSPEIRTRDLKIIVKMLLELYDIDKTIKSKEITLGADPEFMLFNAKSGRMIPASEFFPKDGIVGCDNIRIRNRQQRPIAEIRPKPAESPYVLIENIKEALHNASRLAPYKNVRWVAGSQPVNGYSIGGHIHFSKIKISGTLLRALDNYLGIPIFLIEEPSTAAKRRKKYGFVGDYRVKDHGGFEYRTPGSWLVSQKLATAILCLSKLVVSSYPYLPKNYLNDLEAQEAFYNGSQDYFINKFYTLWKGIENTDLYDFYADDLQIIPDTIINKLTWDEKSDFRKSWKIAPPNRIYTRKAATTQQVKGSVTTSTSTSRRRTTPTRNTRITVARAGGSSTTRRSRPTSTNPRANISRGRIIGSSQVRRSQRIR